MPQGIFFELVSFFSRAFSSLSIRNYRLYWTGQAFSQIGTWMQSTAQGWLVLQLTDSPFYLGLVAMLGSLPILLFSLVGGALADRIPRRLVLLVTQSMLALQALVLGILVVTGTVQVWHVMVLAFLLGLMNAFDRPARQSFLSELVPKEQLMNAIGLNSSTFNMARVIGPSMAGLLISAVGISFCFYLNSLSFLATIGALLLMRLPASPPHKVNLELGKSIAEGVTFVRNQKSLLALLMIAGVTSLFAFSYSSLLPVFARDVLGSNASGLGGLSSAVGLGALLGALNTAAMNTNGRKGRIIVVANLALSAALILFSFSRLYWLSLILLPIVGLSMVMQSTSIMTLLQTHSPDSLRGRVMSTYNFCFAGLAPLGSLLAGTLAQFLGAPIAVLIGALINGGLVTWIVSRRPQLKSLP